MPAVVNYANETGAVELRDLNEPELGPGDALVEVAAVGVCGSDLHQWQALHSWPVNYPVVLGHEFCGTIAKIKTDGDQFREGDRVVSETAAIVDPSSPMTRAGKYNLDPSRKGFGYGVNGAMTKFVRVPLRCLHHIPGALPAEKAALCEPCAVAYNAVVGNVSVNPGDRVLVLGPGPIGILCGVMAKLRGARVAVAGLERDEARLAIARQYGCETLIDDPREWAMSGDGLGVEGVVDAAGVSATLKIALDCVRPAGWISKVGWGRDPVGFSLDPLVQKNVTLQGSFSHNWPIWEAVIRMMADGTLDVGPLIGGVWSLEDWHEAFETMHGGSIAKAVLTP
ncbi:zinc-binding dehydrogenase [Stratiformator vulcanicus]|uniref:D-arabitol-phosphate dehydrogenase n=1 Tax=Stratiformator vulcanicus TaxID=2527980 RepID=A0A517R4X5_9PLAN|nr:zinc-binding dehydrogenase [Stratiformator vulcanicus]QDT38900.1 D-arabitol-phosphate dehydrogenase [Stratiformator vulcanicus]